MSGTADLAIQDTVTGLQTKVIGTAGILMFTQAVGTSNPQSSGNVAASTANLTFAAVAGKTNFISSLVVTGAGAVAASVITVAITGLANGTGSQSYLIVVPAGATTSITPLVLSFVPPLTGVLGGAVSVSVPSFGVGNTNACASGAAFVL